MRWPITMCSVLVASRSDSLWKWIHRLGGPGLILLGIADNTPLISVPAGGVEAFIIVLTAHRTDWWPYCALMATVGEVIGGYLTYRLAEKGGQQTLEKKNRETDGRKTLQAL
jgi:membrane protein YqaA with SNARE-associated domain